MKKILLFAGILSTALFTNAQQTGDFSSSVTWSNNDGSQTRSLAVYVPTNYNASKTYSLVIAFHGLGDDPATYMYYDAKVFANFGDVIVVAPDEGTPSTAWVYTEDNGIVKAVKDEISATYNIGNVFTQGFSYGGKAAYVHGMREAGEIQGIIAYSPAFCGYKDIDETASTHSCSGQHQDIYYENAPKLPLCASAGLGEKNRALLNQTDFDNDPYIENTYWGQTKYLAETAHPGAGGNALWVENSDPSATHVFPTTAISQQCWNFVNANIVTGTVEIEKDAIFMFVHPQPSTGVFNVQFSKEITETVTIEVYDLTGSRIEMTGKINSSNTNASIDLTGNPNGVYLAQIIAGNTVKTVKLNLFN